MKLLKIGTQSNIHSQHINTGTEFVSITRSISNQLLNSITHGVVCIIYVTKRRKLVESFNQHRKDLFDVRTMRYQAKHLSKDYHRQKRPSKLIHKHYILDICHC